MHDLHPLKGQPLPWILPTARVLIGMEITIMLFAVQVELHLEWKL